MAETNVEILHQEAGLDELPEAGNDEEIEQIIINATAMVKKDRNRASFENILKHVNKQGFNIGTTKLKVVTSNLRARIAKNLSMSLKPLQFWNINLPKFLLTKI